MEEDFKFELPFCFIPLRIRENYKGKVRRFYQNKGEKEIEEHARDIQQRFGIEFKLLNWDDELGLRNISFFDGGLDLDTNNFRKYIFHNTEPGSEYGKAAFEVAKKYIEMLGRA